MISEVWESRLDVATQSWDNIKRRAVERGCKNCKKSKFFKNKNLKNPDFRLTVTAKKLFPSSLISVFIAML